MTHALRLEKTPRSVRLYLADGDQIPVIIYTAPTAVQRDAVIDAVQDAEPVLPCKTESGDFLCVGTDAIAAIGIPVGATEEGLFQLRPCEVRLRGGHRFEGSIRHYAGTGDRLSDALRRPQEWIQLEAGPDVIWFRVDRLISALERKSGRSPASSPPPAFAEGLDGDPETGGCEDLDDFEEGSEVGADPLLRSLSGQGAQL